MVAPPEPDADPAVPRFGLDDEAARINVSTAPEGLLENLVALTDQQAASLRDWVDRNEQARPGGAERGYYQDLSLPYEIANAGFRTHRELLLVKDIDAAAFLGEDADADGVLDRRENDGPLTPPDDNRDRQLDRGLAGLTTVYSYDLATDLLGQERINLKQASAGQLIQSFNMTRSLADAVREQAGNADSLFDLVGVSGDGGADEDEIDTMTAEWLADRWEQLTLEDQETREGLINVNTATRPVLEAIPDIPASVVDSILARRDSLGPFTRLGQLRGDDLLDDDQFRQIAPYLTVRTQVFRVVSYGTTPSGTTRRLDVVIDRGQRPAVIRDWRQRG